jgi:Flp pilus assembly protein TadD
LPVVLVMLLAALAMAPLCGHDFTNFDDDRTVAYNASFNPPTFAGVMQYWRQPFMDLYVPVTYMVWGVLAGATHGETGLNPHVFHTFNVLLHAVNAALVLLILRRLFTDVLSPWAVFVGAAVFAVHPVQVETVGWVSGMKDLLCGLFTLAALWGYVKHAQAQDAPARRRWAYFALATAAYILAMLSKPTAVVTPVLALVLDLLVLRNGFRVVAPRIALWLVLAIPCVIWTKYFQSAEHVAFAPPIWQRPLVALDALAFYLGKVVFPWSLAVDYGRRPDVAIARGWVYFTWIVPVAVAVATWLLRRRIPGLLAGGALFVAGMLPVLGLVRFDFQEFSTVADHYLYLPMLGVAVALAAWLVRVPAARWGVVAGVVIALLTARSLAQTFYWSDSETLFRHAVDVNPNSSAVHNSLSAALLERGKVEPAIAHAREAVKLNGADPRPRGTLAAALAAGRMLPEAESEMREMLKLDPENGRALGMLADILAQQGRLDEAMPLARRATELDPNDAAARLVLGTMLAQRGDLPQAARELAAAVRLSRNSRAHMALGFVLADLGRTNEAELHLKKALELDPSATPARDALERLNASRVAP